MQNRCQRLILVLITLLGALVGAAKPALADFVQQGPKLVGTGGVGESFQGNSVALSADGNTAIVGAPNDLDPVTHAQVGAAWVFTRSGEVWTQQGSKLVGTGASGNAGQGQSVALSADGNTAIVGGYIDDASTGAAWMFTRSAGVWTQQGSKLVGTGAIGSAAQGWSVALSADGNTAIVGGDGDNTTTGAAWIFTRSAGVWTQQGSKLVGTGAVGHAEQGVSIALSADGNTAIIGGPLDNVGPGVGTGAAWVFTRSGGVWTQQGAKLVGVGAVGYAGQGVSVALSADGNVAVVGGDDDNNYTGAVWVFTRSGGVWTQQGNKLVGTGAVGGDVQQGFSVSLSALGSTAILGGPNDGDNGAAWVFTRSAGVWTQQGTKLIGTGAVNRGEQGFSVALSADGNTAIVGGINDNIGTGAAWVFVPSTPALVVTPTSNIAASGLQGGPFSPSSFQYQLSTSFGSANFSISGVPTWLDASLTSGTATTTPQTVSFTVNANANTLPLGTYGPVTISFANTDDGTGTQARTATLAALSPTAHDFNGDHISDILWRNSDGGTATWQMNANGTHAAFSFGVVNTAWQIAGTTSLVSSTGDVNHDGKADIVWRNTNGSLSLWEMNGGASRTYLSLGVVNTAWQIAGVGDFDGDGHADILWRHTNGSLSIWKMTGDGTHTSLDFGVVATAWQVAGIGDVNHDGNADIIWRHTNGSLVIWEMNGGTSHTVLNLGAVATGWQIVGVGDVDGDGNADIVWRNTNASLAIWLMNGGTHTPLILGAVSTDWQIVSIGDYDGDGHADILWRHINGSVAIWKMHANGTATPFTLGSVATTWTIVE